MTSSDLFESIRGWVRSKGEPVRFGTLLKEQASSSQLVCEQCGILPRDPGAIGNWLHMCHDAMDHVKETGHRVAVDSWNAAIYGPEDLT